MAKKPSYQMDFAGLEIIADEFTGTVNGALGSVTVLTDSSGGGAADGTISAVPAATQASTDTTAASLTSTNASITALKNAVTELATKVNAIINAMN